MSLLALNPLNRQFQAQPSPKPGSSRKTRKFKSGSSRTSFFPPQVPSPAQPQPQPQPHPPPTQPRQPAQLAPNPPPKFTSPSPPNKQPSPAPDSQNQVSVKKPAQHFRSILSLKTLLAPKPSTISICPKPSPNPNPKPRNPKPKNPKP